MGIMMTVAKRADEAASRADRAATQSERAADRADMRARDADRISRWIVGLMVALFLAVLLQGFETRIALGGLRTELQNAALDRAAIRTELQNEIAAVRAEMAEMRAEIIAVVNAVVTELTRLGSLIDPPDSPRGDP